MDFFKSLISDDPDPPELENHEESNSNSPLKPPSDENNPSPVANGWSFGDLIKTIATQSESVIEVYRKDLQEFQSGLKKETEIFRETASRAVKDLPASLEASASAAHGALDGVIKSTAEIISKEALPFGAGGEPETPDTIRNLSAGRYSWFQAQLRVIQNDMNTFCEDPEDVEEYGKWKLGFKLEENKDEIDSLIGENGTLENVYKRVVPNAVDPENFWSRYFYRVDKLKQQESVRANLVKRAISIDDEEELSWDVDDEEDVNQLKEGDRLGDNVASDQKDLDNASQNEKKVGKLNVDDIAKNNVVDSSQKSSFDGKKDVSSAEVAEVKMVEKANSEEVAEVKMDEKVKSEESVEEENESGKKSDALTVSGKHSKAEADDKDMGWDEIEDTGSDDEKKMLASSWSKNRVDLQKRLSTAEDDDDDLNWDIEDDDEPAKA